MKVELTTIFYYLFFMYIPLLIGAAVVFRFVDLTVIKYTKCRYYYKHIHFRGYEISCFAVLRQFRAYVSSHSAASRIFFRVCTLI